MAATPARGRGSRRPTRRTADGLGRLGLHITVRLSGMVLMEHGANVPTAKDKGCPEADGHAEPKGDDDHPFVAHVLVLHDDIQCENGRNEHTGNDDGQQSKQPPANPTHQEARSTHERRVHTVVTAIDVNANRRLDCLGVRVQSQPPATNLS